MSQPTDELNSLGYNSSQPDIDFAPKPPVNSQDEIDLPTIKRMFALIKQRRAYYDSNAALSIGIDLTIENQVIVNRKVIQHIDELEALLRSTMSKIEEVHNER